MGNTPVDEFVTFAEYRVYPGAPPRPTQATLLSSLGPIRLTPRRARTMHPPTLVSPLAQNPLARAIRAFAILLALGVAPSGCDQFGGSAGVPDYSTTARDNYQRGMNELKKENYADAIKLFEYVRKKFSFSRWATLAELAIADANFGREKYMDAVDEYRTFTKNHPTHEKVTDGYCDFRIGEAYYKEIPSEWFLVPPSYEKDMGPVRDAIRELAAFVVQYPESPHLEKAKRLEEDCVRRLAEHEVYVADFYMRRRRPVAAIGRLEGLVKGTFLPKLASETGNATDRLSVVARGWLKVNMEPKVLLLLGRTYMLMERPDQARLAFERLITQHPDDFHAKKAQKAKERISTIVRRMRFAAGDSSSAKASMPTWPRRSCTKAAVMKVAPTSRKTAASSCQ